MAPASATPPSAAAIAWALFGLRGRTSREVYWLSYAFLIAFNLFLFSVFPGLLDLVIGNPAARITTGSMPGLVGLFASVYVNLAVTVKRLHDFNVAGFVAFGLLVPLVNIGVTIWAGLVPGTPGPNRFGRLSDRPPE